MRCRIRTYKTVSHITLMMLILSRWSYWPSVTSKQIRLSTDFITSIPTLTFTELWVVSMEHLQRMWNASREHLPFRTPGSVPHLGTCLCSNCWDQIPRTCHVFTWLFTSNAPWYFLDFALQRGRCSCLPITYDYPIFTNIYKNWQVH